MAPETTVDDDNDDGDDAIAALPPRYCDRKRERRRQREKERNREKEKQREKERKRERKREEEREKERRGERGVPDGSACTRGGKETGWDYMVGWDNLIRDGIKLGWHGMGWGGMKRDRTG